MKTFTNIYKSEAMFTNIYTAKNMFTNIYKTEDMFTNIYKTQDMFINIYKTQDMFSVTKLKTCLQIFTKFNPLKRYLKFNTPKLEHNQRMTSSWAFNDTKYNWLPQLVAKLTKHENIFLKN